MAAVSYPSLLVSQAPRQEKRSLADPCGGDCLCAQGASQAVALRTHENCACQCRCHCLGCCPYAAAGMLTENSPALADAPIRCKLGCHGIVTNKSPSTSPWPMPKSSLEPQVELPVRTRSQSALQWGRSSAEPRCLPSPLPATNPAVNVRSKVEIITEDGWRLLARPTIPGQRLPSPWHMQLTTPDSHRRDSARAVPRVQTRPWISEVDLRSDDCSSIDLRQVRSKPSRRATSQPSRVPRARSWGAAQRMKSALGTSTSEDSDALEPPMSEYRPPRRRSADTRDGSSALKAPCIEQGQAGASMPWPLPPGASTQASPRRMGSARLPSAPAAMASPANETTEAVQSPSLDFSPAAREVLMNLPPSEDPRWARVAVLLQAMGRADQALPVLPPAPAPTMLPQSRLTERDRHPQGQSLPSPRPDSEDAQQHQGGNRVFAGAAQKLPEAPPQLPDTRGLRSADTGGSPGSAAATLGQVSGVVSAPSAVGSNNVQSQSPRAAASAPPGSQPADSTKDAATEAENERQQQPTVTQPGPAASAGPSTLPPSAGTAESRSELPASRSDEAPAGPSAAHASMLKVLARASARAHQARSAAALHIQANSSDPVVKPAAGDAPDYEGAAGQLHKKIGDAVRRARSAHQLRVAASAPQDAKPAGPRRLRTFALASTLAVESARRARER
mmetsp:Transcript_14637/g.32062  ORF Transcript_14637/g.32062 Transcript_14637/m.32062 type:complete len:676 (-) Transcript_14637:78-2105(-)